MMEKLKQVMTAVWMFLKRVGAAILMWASARLATVSRAINSASKSLVKAARSLMRKEINLRLKAMISAQASAVKKKKTTTRKTKQ